MKKKVILIAFGLMVVSLFLVVKYSEGAKTIEEAINPFGSMNINIIHKEKNNKGTIVFSHIPNGDGLYTAVVKKGIGGYETVYSGAQGDEQRVLEKFGLTHSFFPATGRTTFPIYFGLIGNNDISKVKIIEGKRNIESEAKIINANGMRIWIAFMNKLEGSDFDIIGLSEDGKELTKIDGDITPYYME